MNSRKNFFDLAIVFIIFNLCLLSSAWILRDSLENSTEIDKNGFADNVGKTLFQRRRYPLFQILGIPREEYNENFGSSMGRKVQKNMNISTSNEGEKNQASTLPDIAERRPAEKIQVKVLTENLGAMEPVMYKDSTDSEITRKETHKVSGSQMINLKPFKISEISPVKIETLELEEPVEPEIDAGTGEPLHNTENSKEFLPEVTTNRLADIPIETQGHENFYIITALFNLASYQIRFDLYHKFAAHIASSGAKLITVECIFSKLNQTEFKVTSSSNPLHIQIKSDSIFWIKENLINVAVSRLPLSAEYVAWIDADIHFQETDWIQQTILALQKYSVVQTFKKAHFLSADDEIMFTDYSFGYAVVQGLPFTNTLEYPHPGYSWAMRKKTFDEMGGLPEYDIVGSIDLYFAYSLIDRTELTIDENIDPVYRERIMEASHELYTRMIQISKREEKQGIVGYAPLTISHDWHGSRQDRGYVERLRILAVHQFNFFKDMQKGDDGLYRFVGNKMEELHEDMMCYFESMNEGALVDRCNFMVKTEDLIEIGHEGYGEEPEYCSKDSTDQECWTNYEGHYYQNLDLNENVLDSEDQEDQGDSGTVQRFRRSENGKHYYGGFDTTKEHNYRIRRTEESENHSKGKSERGLKGGKHYYGASDNTKYHDSRVRRSEKYEKLGNPKSEVGPKGSEHYYDGSSFYNIKKHNSRVRRSENGKHYYGGYDNIKKHNSRVRRSENGKHYYGGYDNIKKHNSRVRRSENGKHYYGGYDNIKKHNSRVRTSENGKHYYGGYDNIRKHNSRVRRSETFEMNEIVMSDEISLSTNEKNLIPKMDTPCEVTLAVVLCKDEQLFLETNKHLFHNFQRQITQMMVLLKSIVLTERFPEHGQYSRKNYSKCVNVILVANDLEILEDLQRLIYVDENWDPEFTQFLRFSFVPAVYPTGYEWMYREYRACATIRLFLDQILPDTDAVIYTDTDVVFLRSIRYLWKEFNNFHPSNVVGLIPEWNNTYYEKELYNPTDYQSGVILMNLTRMREVEWSKKIGIVSSLFLDDALFADQDILIIYFKFFPMQLHDLPCHWNFAPRNCKFGKQCATNGISLIQGLAGSFLLEDFEVYFERFFDSYRQFSFGRTFSIDSFIKELGNNMWKNRKISHHQCNVTANFGDLVMKSIQPLQLEYNFF